MTAGRVEGRSRAGAPRRGAGAQPFLLAHRGVMASQPENSLPAFRAAVRDGADGVELDVRLSADDEVLVFHDADLVRLAGDRTRVRDLPWSRLATLTLAAGVTIPRLKDVLASLPENFIVNVEIKIDSEDGGVDDRAVLVARTASVLADAGGHLRLLVSSFDRGVVQAWAASVPEIPVGYLFEGDVPADLPPVSAVHPHHALCTRARVAAWHDHGLAVNVWTLEGGERVRAIAAMGVDAIISNDPAATRAHLDQYES